MKRHISPLQLIWLALRIGFRIFGKKRRQKILKYFGWPRFRAFRKDVHIRFPIFARLGNSQFSKEEKLLSQLSGQLFVDVGAYDGYYSILVRNKFDKIYAIEPHPGNLVLLKKNIKKAKADNIHIIELAVSDKSQTKIPLFLGNTPGNPSLIRDFAGGMGGVSGVWSESVSSRTGIRHGDKIYVDTITLTELLVNEPSIDFVKVDVEGAEWQVIDGAEPIVDKIYSWLIEVHYRNFSELENLRTKMKNWLKKKGYKTRWIDHNHIYGWR